VIVIFNALCLIAVFVVMWRGRSHVKPIFNRIV